MEAITREEKLMDGQDVKPITRKEKILAGEDLKTITREEYFLKKYRGGGGGDITVESLNVTENGTYTAPTGKAYSPVNVELPLDSKTITANGTYTASDDNLAGFNEVTVAVEGYAKKSIPNTPTPIATFNASALPMPSLTVGIEATQDLHGQDYPWPAGGGKNLFDKPNLVMNKAIPQGTVIYGQIFGVTASFKLYGYDEENNEYEVMSLSINKNSTTTTRAYVRLEISQSALNALGNGNLMVSLSDFTRFEPYSNICPFTGFSTVNRYVVGENLYNIRESRYMPEANLQKLNSGDTLYVNTNFASNFTLYIRYTGDEVATEYAISKNTLTTITLTNTVEVIAISQSVADNITGTGKDVKIYHNGTTYTTTIKDSQGNPMECYGGELSNENGVQSLDNNEFAFYLHELNWTQNANRPDIYNGYATFLDDRKGQMNWNDETCFCEAYKGNTSASILNGQIALANSIGSGEVAYRIYVRDERFVSDVQGFVAEITNNPVKCVLPLATPQTIPQDNLSIASQDGINNIWADTGDVLEGSYFKEL